MALEIKPLPAVVNAQDAVAEGAPVLYEHVPGNIASISTKVMPLPFKTHLPKRHTLRI